MKEKARQFLDKHNITYQWYDHLPVFTCAESQLININLPGQESKNLFLRNNKGDRHAVVCVLATKKVNLKQLGKDIGYGGIGFASADRMVRFLNLTPGSVTLLGVLNDLENKVDIYIDKELWTSGPLRCHPLQNDATVVLMPEELQKIFSITGHNPGIISIPVQN